MAGYGGAGLGEARLGEAGRGVVKSGGSKGREGELLLRTSGVTAAPACRNRAGPAPLAGTAEDRRSQRPALMKHSIASAHRKQIQNITTPVSSRLFPHA